MLLMNGVMKVKGKCVNFWCPSSNPKSIRKRRQKIPQDLIHSPNQQKASHTELPATKDILSISGRVYNKSMQIHHFTSAKIPFQKEGLTFDVHELQISQCWFPKLTYRWHTEQNLKQAVTKVLVCCLLREPYQWINSTKSCMRNANLVW